MGRLREIGGRRLPVLRWSFVRMLVGIRHLTKTWQVGDGREAALGEYVLANARPDDVNDAIRAIDEFCYRQSFMMNVGDEKGALLDAAIDRVRPTRLVELGTYCGYSALRTVRAMPDQAHLYSIEFNPDNAAIARRILDHAGVNDRVTVVVGTLGGDGDTIATLEALDHVVRARELRGDLQATFAQVRWVPLSRAPSSSSSSRSWPLSAFIYLDMLGRGSTGVRAQIPQ